MYPANEAKFWARVEKSPKCWTWQGARTPQGYGHGSWKIEGHLVQLAHRVAYLLLVGGIPEGLVLDHLCRNPSCVNPAHLEPVTPWENTHGRGTHRNTLVTHCPAGHPYDEANTYRGPRGVRDCRACRNEASKRHRVRHREELNEHKRLKRQEARADARVD